MHTLAAGLGVSAILLASAEAFAIVKIAGAIDLAYLGIRALLSAARRLRDPDGVAAGDAEHEAGRSLHPQGAALDPVR